MYVLSSKPRVVRSAASRRILAVATSEGMGGGGLRFGMMLLSHVFDGRGRDCEVRAEIS